MAAKKVVELDGRTLEGGGQLVRLATCLSALTGTPIRITNIRGNRPKNGGLKAQHLACVLWLARACNATVIGAEKGSQTLDFTPGTINGGLSPVFKRERQTRPEAEGEECYTARFDIGTAGATTLGLQAILPFILFASYPKPLPVHLTLTGGTNVSFSPSYDYIAHVLLPMLHAIGLPKLEPSLARRGWSTGDSRPGEWTLRVPARPHISLPAFALKPFITKDGIDPKLNSPKLFRAVFVGPSNWKTTVQEAFSSALKNTFHPDRSGSIKLDVEWNDSGDPRRMYLLLTASGNLAPSSSTALPQSGELQMYTVGQDALVGYNPRKSRSPEALLVKVVQSLVREVAFEWNCGGCVDEHSRDQLIVFAALASGRSVVHPGIEDGNEREPSLHTRTAEWVARQVLGSGVRFQGGGKGTEGIGFGRSSISPVNEGEVENLTAQLDTLVT